MHAIPKKQLPNAQKQAEQIRFCLQQAEEYYEAAKVVSLATKPTLLYYSTMCLALAELLFKQSGESSLDRARGQHRHHGLSATIECPKTNDLVTVCEGMKATPLDISGKRAGKIELWHRSARPWPIAGTYIGQSMKSLRLMTMPVDERLPLVPDSGISLLDCFKAIPGLLNLMWSYGIQPDFVRCAPIVRQAGENYDHIILPFHPGPQPSWDAFSSNILVNPRDIECVEFNDFGNFGNLVLTLWPNLATEVRFTEGVNIGFQECRFWTNHKPLNEFGFFYVALFILGNYARYFPDKWIPDVDDATPIAHVVDEFMALAYQRLPLIALCELGQCLYITCYPGLSRRAETDGAL